MPGEEANLVISLHRSCNTTCVSQSQVQTQRLNVWTGGTLRRNGRAHVPSCLRDSSLQFDLLVAPVLKRANNNVHNICGDL